MADVPWAFGNSPYNDPDEAAGLLTRLGREDEAQQLLEQYGGVPSTNDIISTAVGGDPSKPTKDALSMLYELGQSNPEYMELYLQLLAERENTTSAQKWYEEMSGSQYQRAYKDLQKAGINPYLALQSLGGAGSGSVQPAGTWSTSPYANKKNAENQKMNAESNMIKALLGAGTAIIGILAMLL